MQASVVLGEATMAGPNGPCQDVAKAGFGRDFAWAIVSDGCSQGGRTELGANLWARAAQRELLAKGIDALQDLPDFADRLVARATPTLRALDFEDGYATVAVLVANKDRVRAAVFGDGVLVFCYRDGRIRFWDVHTSNNTPRYLQYALNEHSLREWEKQATSQTLKVFENLYDSEGVLLKTEASRFNALEKIGFQLEVPRDENLESVSVCTDGVLDFEGRGAYRALRALTTYRFDGGPFQVEALKTLRSNGFNPQDDVGIATLRF